MNVFKLYGEIKVDDKDAKSKIDGVTKTAKDAEGKMGSAFGNIGESVKKAFTVGAVIGFEKKVIGTYKTYDDQMRKVQAVTNATGKEYDALRDRAEELGKQTRFSATEAGEGMEALGRAGWSTEQIMAGIGETLTFATANSIELGEASSIVADGLSQFGMKAEETGRFTDILSATARASNTDIGLLGDTLKYVGPVAGSLGYKLEDVAVATGLMANNGIKGSAAGTAMRNIMTRLVKPTKESGTAMDQLGISVTDASGEMKPFNVLMGDLRQAFSKLTPEQQAQYAASIAGQQGMSGLLAIVNASPEEFDAMTEAINNSNGVTEEMMEIMDGGLGGAIEGVKSAWENLLIQFGKTQDEIVTDLLKVLADVLMWLGDVVKLAIDKFQEFKKWLDENEKIAKILTATLGAFALSLAIGPAISAIVGLLKTLGGGFTKVLGAVSPVNILIGIFAGLAMAIYQNWDTIGPWLTDLWEKIKSTFKKGVDWVKNLIETVWDGIAKFFIKAWEVITAPFKLIWEVIKATVKGAINIVKSVIEGTIKGIQSIWQAIWGAIGDYVKFTWELIKAIVEGAILVVKTIIQTYLNIIKSIWTNIWNAVKSIAETVWSGIKSVIESVINGIKSIIESVMNAIKSVMESIWNNIKSTVENIINSIKSVIENVMNAIKSVMENIWNSIKSVTQNVWNSIKTTITNILNPIQNFIRSKMDAIKNTVTNVWNNIKSVTQTIWNAIKSIITNVINAIKNTVTNVFNAIKNTVTNIWNGVKNTTSNIWNGIKSTITNIINGIKNSVTNVFNGIKNTTANVWNNVKDAMTRPIEQARDKIKGVLDRIKGFFSGLKLKFPKIEMPKLPRFSLDGEFSLKPPSVPRLAVDWYADGGILTKPTIFGAMGSNLLGGGEAGPEAVLPIEKLSGILAETMDMLGYGQDGNRGDIIQNVTINSPKYLSPAETARENKKALQRLALEY